MAYLTMSDGVKIYYEDNKKDGKTLLFCHGLNSFHTLIKKFIDEFRGNYHVICYDQRGHENSVHPKINMNINRLGKDLNEIIEQLKLDDIIVIGHSMGAASIFNYVNYYGCDRLKKIVAVDMSPYMRNTIWEGGIGMGK